MAISPEEESHFSMWRHDYKQILKIVFFLFFACIVEMATLTRVNEKTVIKILTNADVDALIAKYEKIEAELEAAKREKLAQKSWAVGQSSAVVHNIFWRIH